MALEDLKLNIRVKKKKKPEEPKPFFSVKSVKKAVANVKVADWLKDKTVEEVSELWKIGHSAKKLSANEQLKFKEIKSCLKYKFGLKGV
jgi:hypothetical protein